MNTGDPLFGLISGVMGMKLMRFWKNKKYLCTDTHGVPRLLVDAVILEALQKGGFVGEDLVVTQNCSTSRDDVTVYLVKGDKFALNS